MDRQKTSVRFKQIIEEELVSSAKAGHTTPVAGDACIIAAVGKILDELFPQGVEVRP